MNRSRRVSIGLLTLAVGSLAVDRLFLSSEPAGASAAIVASTPALQSGATRPEESLADVLATLAGSIGADTMVGELDLRESFAAPISWRETPATEPVKREAPLPRLTMSSTSALAAVINGQAVRVGAFIDKDGLIRLASVDVERASADIEFSGRRYRIEVGSEEATLIGSEWDSAGRAGSESSATASGG